VTGVDGWPPLMRGGVWSHTPSCARSDKKSSDARCKKRREGTSRTIDEGTLRQNADTTGNAIRCNTLQPVAEKTAWKCGICNPRQAPATLDRSLVMSRGKRFESARRLSFCLQNP
jgi:hypothetical protein